MGCTDTTGNGGTNPTASTSTSATATVPSLIAISLSPTNPTLAIGMTLQMSALGYNDDGSLQNLTSTVTWSSSDATIASVDASGTVTAVSGGQVIITTSSGTVTSSMPVTISSAPVSATLSYITITPANPVLALGSTVQLQVIGTYTNSSQLDLTSSVTWNSTNGTIASVSVTGLLSGIGARTAFQELRATIYIQRHRQGSRRVILP